MSKRNRLLVLEGNIYFVYAACISLFTLKKVTKKVRYVCEYFSKASSIPNCLGI